MPVLNRIDSVNQGVEKIVDAVFFENSIQQDPDVKVSPTRPSSLRLHIAETVTTKLEYTVDDGTTWIKINDDDAIVAGVGKVFLIPIRDDSLFNLRNKTTSTIIVCEVDEIRENS